MPDPYILPLSGFKVDETLSRTAYSDITVQDLLTYLNNLSTLPDETVVFRTAGRVLVGDSPVRQFVCRTGTHTDNGGTIRTISGDAYIKMVYWDGDVRDFENKTAAEAAFAQNLYPSSTETLNNFSAATINGGVPALREETPSENEIAVINADGDSVGSGVTKEELLELQTDKANKSLSNVDNNSVTFDLLSAELQTSLAGGLDPEDYIGAITSLTDDFLDPTANTGKWAFIDGISGTFTGANAPVGIAEDGGYVFSNGTNWLLRGASPTNIVNNSITLPKLEDDVRRRFDDFKGRAMVWGVSDENDRTPLYLKPTGKLVFTPEDGTVGEGALVDGSVTAGKLGENSVTQYNLTSDSVGENELADDSVKFTSLTDDVARRIDNLENRSAVWAITDDEGRSPLYLNRSGKLQFTPEFNTITRDSIQEDAINGSKIEGLSVDTVHLANEAVTGDKIQDGSITQDKLGFEVTATALIDPVDSVTVTKSKETSLFTDSQNGEPSEVNNDQIDWKSFPQYTAAGFTVDNTVSDVTNRDLLVRKKNAIPVGHFYMGDWDSSVASHNITKYWANAIGKLPHPATNTSSDPVGLAYRWRSGFWWRIKNTVTIDGVTYNQDDVLVYRAMFSNTGTAITDPSTQLGWNTYGSTSLVRKGATWNPNESPVNPLDNFTFEYEGECVEVDATGNGYRKGDLVVYKPNSNPNTDQFIVRKTYDVTTISAGATENFSGAPVDYEYRHDTSADNPFMFSFKYHSTSKKTLFKSSDGDLKLFNEDNGVTDDLAELNALDFVQNPKLSENARYVYFYGNAQQGSSNNLALHVFDTEDRVIRIDNNRNVTLLGDSIANHFFSRVAYNVQQLDTENGLTARDFYNHGKGSAHDTHSLESFKYFLEQNTDIASRILLAVADFGEKFDRSMELFTHLVSLMPSYSRRYLFCDMYQYQRLLTYNSGLGRFTANNTQDLTAERRYFEAFGNALEGTGNFVSYYEMIAKSPEAVAYMDSVYDPQFPDYDTQLQVVEEFGCMPWYNVKETGSQQPLPISNPNDFILKFQGYLSATDPTPSGSTTDKNYYLTSEVSTRTVNGVEESNTPVGTMIWYDGVNSNWVLTKAADLHPSDQARSIIGDVYKRLFSERKWF